MPIRCATPIVVLLALLMLSGCRHAATRDADPPSATRPAPRATAEVAPGSVVDDSGMPIHGALVRHHLVETVVKVGDREAPLLTREACAVSGGLGPRAPGDSLIGVTFVASAPGYQRQALTYRGEPLQFTLTRHHPWDSGRGN